MLFDRLVVFAPRMCVWETQSPQSLADLLRFLFSDNLPGSAWLNADGNWITADDALNEIAIAQKHWIEVPQAQGEELVTQRYRYRVFLDGDRSREVLSAGLSKERGALEAALREHPVCVGLKIEFRSVLLPAQDRKKWHLSWIPSFWDCWPDSSIHAPSPIYEAARQALDTRQASDRLWFLWSDVDNSFNNIRTRFKLRSPKPQMLRAEAGFPVFHLAFPTEEIPSDPRSYYKSPWRSVLADLVRWRLQSEDPFSSQVACSALEGALLVLRRELTQEGQFFRPYYLCLPFGESTEGRWARWEDLSDRVVTNLHYSEFKTNAALWDVFTDEEKYGYRGKTYAGIVDNAVTYLNPLFRYLEMFGGQRKKVEEIQQAMGLVHRTLLQGEGDAAALVLRVSELYDLVKMTAHEARAFFERQLTERTLDGHKPLRDALCDSLWFQEAYGRIARARENTERAHGTYEAILNNLAGFSEALRARELGVLERFSYFLNVVLALLAAVLAWSVLVKLEMPDVPVWLIWPLRVVTGLVAATGLWMVYRGLSAWRRERAYTSTNFRKTLDDVVLVLRQISDLGALSKTTSELDSLDRECASKLAAAFDDIKHFPLEPEESRFRRIRSAKAIVTSWIGKHLGWRPDTFDAAGDIRYLLRGIERWCLKAMVISERPELLGLPRVACLYRFKSTAVLEVSSPFISDFELEEVMQRAVGIDSETYRDILVQWGELEGKDNKTSASEFLAKLNDLGLRRNMTDSERKEFVEKLRTRLVFLRAKPAADAEQRLETSR